MEEYQNRGYLLENFRLFHIRDRTSLEEINFHYHEFHKLLWFCSGNAQYVVEGLRYDLCPGDGVLIARGCIHRPEVGTSAPYERYVLYLSPAYLRACSRPDCDLELCFTASHQSGQYLLRASEDARVEVQQLLAHLQATVDGSEYGSGALAQLLVQQLLILLDRLVLRGDQAVVPAVCDEKIVAMLAYLSDHLADPLSIDELAERFYLSKYHMMRRFKAETGYTIHSYITNKRLLWANDLLQSGRSATDACYSCGYQDYSAFLRAYKKQFGHAPSAMNRAER